MKIGNSSDNAIGPVAGTRSEGVGSTTTPGKTTSLDGGVNSSAKVTLSTTATGLMTGADTDFDADKVARIRESISNGTYKVNPDAIADKLISNAQDLLQPVED